MASSNQILLHLLLLFFHLIFAASPLSASALVSDAVVGYQAAKGRSLLQVAKPCPVDIENQNYTIITSQCKAPDYPPEQCCSSFTQLVCPFAAQMNDLTNDCSDKLFSYLSTVGQYPKGLFASICRGNKDGLPCPAAPPSPTPNAATPTPLVTPLIFIALLLLFPLHFLVL